ncbi:hypothetical protein [Streptomyces kebangsaanensis]|uniref:Uncharacterized protein n=1 Tax=Streptomyces kebangsaanensis TaxID=864058 RepID=A0ABW6L1Q1_9ACTN|nr:hypothetical protein [Streptomyces kebangsaanensis]
MTDPAPTDPCPTWTPQAALGLTCIDCHPEHRDDHQDDDSRIRPEASTETVLDGREGHGLPRLPDAPVDELPWREELTAAEATGGRTAASPGQPATTDKIMD